MEINEPKGTKVQGKRKGPRTKGLKKALKEEEKDILLDEELELEDKIALEVNQDREYWLDKVNSHLEKLLKKANRDNRLLRHMELHYQAQNMICNVKVKQLENKPKEALKDQNDKGNLEMLDEASMRA